MSNSSPVGSRPEPVIADRRVFRWVEAWISPDACTSDDLAGWIGLIASDRGLRRLLLADDSLAVMSAKMQNSLICRLHWTPLLCRAYWQLRAYLSGRLGRLSAPVDLRDASPFQQAALDQARAIPPGQTRSYGQVARALGRPTAARAVGRAMATNPVPLMVPCHRVISADGSLGGFSAGLARKRALLRLENARAAGDISHHVVAGGT